MLAKPYGFFALVQRGQLLFVASSTCAYVYVYSCSTNCSTVLMHTVYARALLFVCFVLLESRVPAWVYLAFTPFSVLLFVV